MDFPIDYWCSLISYRFSGVSSILYVDFPKQRKNVDGKTRWKNPRRRKNPLERQVACNILIYKPLVDESPWRIDDGSKTWYPDGSLK